MSVKLNEKFINGFVSDSEIKYMAPYAALAHSMLVDGKGQGNDFHGWVKLPENYDKEEFARIKAAAEKIMPGARFIPSSLPASQAF